MVNAAIDDVAAAGLAANRRIKPTFGYYRQPNGWITISPTTRLELIKYEERGWKCLRDYGNFDLSVSVVNHPYDSLFMFGGAKEMPVDQIIAMGFHLNPPQVPRCGEHITQFHRGHTKACWQGAQPAVFPQLEDVDPGRLVPFACEFCERILPTSAARLQHQTVAHKDELTSVRSGRSLAEAIALQQSPAQSPDVTALLKRIEDLEAAQRGGPVAPEDQEQESQPVSWQDRESAQRDV